MTTGPNLSVNVDHVATLRQARRAAYPDPVEAARAAQEAGAAGITVHLRADRRHIQDRDVIALCAAVRGKLNLEMAANEEMLALALERRPSQVTLVPERPEEITTEGGLDLTVHGGRLAAAAARLGEGGIEVSAFIDPEERQVAALSTLGRGLFTGFEMNTDAYTRARAGAARDEELARLVLAAAIGSAAGLRVYAGHGLTSENVGPVAAISEVEELNIGHWIVARAVIVGMRQAVEEMLRAISTAPRSSGATAARRL